MTTLVDWQIYDAIVKNHEIVIEPFTAAAIQPSSLDLRLGSQLYDPAQERLFDIPAEGYLLRQGDFLLGATLETIGLDHYILGRLEGKSSRARQGLIVEAAGLVDQGFQGQLTLEMYNMCSTPVLLIKGDWIGQITFERTMTVQYPYNSQRNHYQNQMGPTPAWNEAAMSVAGIGREDG